MNLYQLHSNGEFPKEFIEKFGKEYTPSQLIKNGKTGMGQLVFSQSTSSSINDLFFTEKDNVKSNISWTEKGLIIRVMKENNLYAFGFLNSEITKIELIKSSDYIYALPLFPFWILLRLRVSLKISKFFMSRSDRLILGDCSLKIMSKEQDIAFKLKGDLWNHCISTFNPKNHLLNITIKDNRDSITENGFKINA